MTLEHKRKKIAEETIAGGQNKYHKAAGNEDSRDLESIMDEWELE